MALPIPTIYLDMTEPIRTKFALDGASFAFLVAEWPIILPPDPPDIVDNAAPDRYEEGDFNAITHILYRIIEDRETPARTMLPTDVHNSIVADTTQDETQWTQQGATDFWYQDRVYSISDAQKAAGKHTATMPNLVVDAKTKCYWVTAWLGVDADNILVGYTVP